MKRNFPAIAVIAAAALLVILGIVQRQPAQVMSKAIRICMECIGIG